MPSVEKKKSSKQRTTIKTAKRAEPERVRNRRISEEKIKKKMDTLSGFSLKEFLFKGDNPVEVTHFLERISVQADEILINNVSHI